MSINNRIRLIRDKFCNGDNAEFAKVLGTSQQYASNISNEGKSVGSKLLDKILKLFPSVNPVWLRIGEGEMLISNSEAKNETAQEPSVGYEKKPSVDKYIEIIQSQQRTIETLSNAIANLSSKQHIADTA